MTDDLAELSAELYTFADTAEPALGSLTPVLERAERLLDKAAPVVAQLRSTGGDLRGVARGVRPVGDELLEDNLGDLMDFVRKWALSTNGKDALSHYFRGVVHVTPRTLSDLANFSLPSSPSTTAQDGTAPPVPDLGLPELGQQDGSKSGLLDLGGLLGGSKTNKDDGSATGLTQKQEDSLLGQLLGGR